MRLTIISGHELHHGVRIGRKEYTMDGLVYHQIRDLDALVVGAGFGGIYTLDPRVNSADSTTQQPF